MNIIPEEIKKFAGSYKEGSWQQYELNELGNWVHLLAKRAKHRKSLEKMKKDLDDANYYSIMLSAKLNEIRRDLIGDVDE